MGASSIDQKKTFKIFIVAGILIFLGGIAFGVYAYLFNSNSADTTAEIVELESYMTSTGKTAYRVYVTYEVDGIAYEHIQIDYSSLNKSVGDIIDISYNIDDPSEIQSKSNSTAVILIMVGVGAIFIAAGISKLKETKKAEN